MILCYNSLLKSLCYQTEESNPILQTNFLSLQFNFLESYLCNSILCTKRTLRVGGVPIPLSGEIVRGVKGSWGTPPPTPLASNFSISPSWPSRGKNPSLSHPLSLLCLSLSSSFFFFFKWLVGWEGKMMSTAGVLEDRMMEKRESKKLT